MRDKSRFSPQATRRKQNSLQMYSELYEIQNANPSPNSALLSDARRVQKKRRSNRKPKSTIEKSQLGRTLFGIK